jgi:hypothetical protein
MILIPAYGRVYTSQKSVLTDWDGGKDFYRKDFYAYGYTSKSDYDKGVFIEFRYGKNLEKCFGYVNK